MVWETGTRSLCPDHSAEREDQKDPKYKKVYAEKLLMLKEGQHSPMHFHWTKSEDIIIRGGGTLIIHVYNADENEKLADTDVCVNSDGALLLCSCGNRGGS